MGSGFLINVCTFAPSQVDAKVTNINTNMKILTIS